MRPYAEMDWIVAPPCIVHVVQDLVNCGPDHFGLLTRKKTARVVATAILDGVSETGCEAIEPHFADVLNGRRPDLRAGLARAAADMPPLHPVTRDLLEHEGLEPDALVVVASIAGGIVLVRDGGTCNISKGTDDWFLETVSPPGPIGWSGNGTVSIDGLPVDVAMHLEGRLLGEVVSHPVFDRHPMRIVGVDLPREIVHPHTGLRVQAA